MDAPHEAALLASVADVDWRSLSHRERQLYNLYGLIWAVQQAHPFNAEDQHDLAFFLAGSCYFRFNPVWLQEAEDFNRLTTFLESQQRAAPHLDFFYEEIERLTKLFNFEDATLLLMAAACYRYPRSLGAFWPDVVREFTHKEGPLTIMYRPDPTIGTKAQRFPLVTVAATLFVHYLSRQGGGALSNNAALDRLAAFPPPYMDERQHQRNLRRFSCLLDAPYCQLSRP